jgi:hypothetical protein
MEGIQYVTNEKGEKIAVQISLKKFGELGRTSTITSLPRGEPKSRESR